MINYPRGEARKLRQAIASVIGQTMLGAASMLLILSAAVREERGFLAMWGCFTRAVLHDMLRYCVNFSLISSEGLTEG